MSHENEHQRFIEWEATFRRPIAAYLFSMTRDGNLAEDLTQETFCNAWRHRANYDASQGTPRAYLFRIASRVLTDFYRKRRETTLDEATWAELERTDEKPSVVEVLEQNDDLRHVRETLATLTPIQQQVLSLRFYGQLKYAEIAETLGLPLGTVVSHAQRGLNALKNKLGVPE